VSIVAAAFVLTASMAWFAGRAGARTNIEDATRSIAVLPFVNVSGSEADEHFTDGLADELLNLLGRIDGLKVAARTSSFAFRGRSNDIRMIGDSLGVLTVLEGTVRRDGQRVRVTANLVNVADGMAVWSEQYDDDITQIFQVQERMARAIAKELELRLGRNALSRRGVVNPEALDYYLLGLERFRQRANGTQVKEAIAHFERAIAIDPQYAQAYGGLAMSWAVLPAWDTISTQSTAPRVREYAQRAMELDDRLPEPYAALCQSLGVGEWKWVEAEEACHAAIERNGSFESAHAWLGEMLAALGRDAESTRSFDRAVLIDPYSPVIHNMAGLGAYSARDFPRADSLIVRALQLDSTMVTARMGAGAIDLAQGEKESALQRFASTMGKQAADMFFVARRDSSARNAVGGFYEMMLDKRESNWATSMAAGFALMGDRERALKYLQIAFDLHEFSLATTSVTPMFDDVRDDARFREIVRGMGLDPDNSARTRAMRVNTSRD
jgi:adenylate cyclase